MTMNVQALRGATTLEVDESDHLLARVEELLGEMITRNSLQNSDLISILFTATPDIHSVFPAVAARKMGYGDVPLMCAKELDISGAMPLCVRIMMHINTDRARGDLRHVYLEQARSLRDDLPE